MVATIARAASADYYMHSQASFRPPDEYYTGGEEPDGIWWNPSALFESGEHSLNDLSVVDSADFYKLYNGFHPRTGEKLTQNSGSAKRCPAYDLTFNADKTISALWAMADPELRAEIEMAHNDAVQVALEDIVSKYCSNTRIADKDRNIHIVSADLMAALFQHGASRSGDPHLHTHCVIFNVARTHRDGKWRALHGQPLYSWQKAAGAVYRAEVAWLLRERLGIDMEAHGKKNAYTRVAGMPEDLVKDWSKRDVEITDTAARMGVVLDGKGALHSAIQRSTRTPKAEGIDPEERYLAWHERAGEFVENVPAFTQSLTGQTQGIPQERLRKVTENLDALPDTITHHDAVVWYNDIVRQVADSGMGLLSREARETALSRVLHSPALVRLDRPKPSPDAAVDLAHTRAYTSANNLQAEQDIHALTTKLAAAGEFAIPPAALEAKVEQLEAENYPLSGEQVAAIHFAASPGRIAIIEGAAGSGKTTTLRPLADLYRDQGCKVIATGVPWVVSEALGNDLAAPNFSVAKLVSMVERGNIAIDSKTVIVVDEAGMLSSQQARRILRLGSEHGAKLIFAGDTEQQQPVTAGPGLRLIRDVAGSIRVDKMRRQLPDAEDVLVALYGDDRDNARLNAALMRPSEQEEILAEYRALPDDRKPQITPWQVAASDAFRRADAGAGIEAYAARGRFHMERDLEATLDRLVDDWDTYRTSSPDKSSIVIAQSNAEVSTLSFLMRERSIETGKTPPVTIQACRGRDPEAKPTPLEIAVGDRIRIGALHWQKQLFNGTVVTVDELRQTTGEDGTVRAWIRGHTDRGRQVSFWHDEIKSFHGQIRLDYGYAMTMASSQGMTVDRAFVLANQKPARETIYPAATRHRERLDFYIDRKPLEFEIREQRPEDEAGDAVTDKEIREHLAQRWSRLQPKEAAKDYMSEEMLADIRSRPAATLSPDRRSGPAWLGANDNGNGALAAAASRMRYSELAAAHGATAETLGEACRDLAPALETWQAIDASDGNAAFALDPAFEADFQRSLDAIDAARPFIEGGARHEQLLRDRAGITAHDLADLADRHRALGAVRAKQRSNGHDVGERAAASPSPRPLPADPDQLAGELLTDLDRLTPAEEFAASEPAPDHAETADLAPPEFEADPGLLQAYEEDLAHTHDPAGAELDAGPGEPVQPPIEPAPTPPAARADAREQPSQAQAPPTAVSAAEAVTLHRRFLANAIVNRRAAHSRGLHPYETQEAPGLIEQARALLRLEALPAARARALRDDVAAYDEWFRSRRRAPGPAPANPGPRQKPPPAETRPATVSAAEAVTLHRRFLANAIRNRRAAHSRGLHPYETEEAPALIEQARALLRLEALPAARARALRDDVAAYDEWLGSGRPAPKPVPGAEQPRQHLRKSRAQAEFDALYDRFLADDRANRTAARQQGVHPYMTEEAPRIIRQARELIRLGRLPPLAAETLSETIVEYERMRARAAQVRARSTPSKREATHPARTASKQAHGDAATTAPKTAQQPASEPHAQSRSTAAAPSPAAATAKPDPARSAETRSTTTPTQEPTPARDALQEYRAWIERTGAELELRLASWPDPPNRRAPVPEPAPAPEPPPRELTPDELFEKLQQRCDANREAALAQNIEPYETEDWRSIHEAAKHLVNRKDAPHDALPYIRELISGYYRWETRQNPRHDPPAQSHRIRY